MAPHIKIEPQALERLRQIDLVTYLQRFEPDNLVPMRGREGNYCTKEHDSLKISNGKWYWWSQRIGGTSALDFLMKVRGLKFQEAVSILSGQQLSEWTPPPPKPVKEQPKTLRLPPKNKDNNQVVAYLSQRKILTAVIRDCIQRGLLYESAGAYQNAVFVGLDDSGREKFAAYRGLGESNYKRDATGSDKRFAFRLSANTEECNCVHVFEGAIDALSYATYMAVNGKDYRQVHLLSLSGVAASATAGDKGKSKIPVALSGFLDSHPGVKRIIFHLDNDEAGRTATRSFTEALGDSYEIVDRPPPYGKDVNEFLGLYFERRMQRTRQLPSRERGDAR